MQKYEENKRRKKSPCNLTKENNETVKHMTMEKNIKLDQTKRKRTEKNKV